MNFLVSVITTAIIVAAGKVEMGFEAVVIFLLFMIAMNTVDIKNQGKE